MKKSLLPLLIIVTSMLLVSNKNIAQVLNMGSLVNYAAYTGTGSITNTGNTKITGHLGSSSGAITGFGSSSLNTMSGNTNQNNAVTDSDRVDLLNIYIHLQNVALTNTTHAAAFGAAETLFPGVYSIGSAGTLSGAITLDGQNNSNSFFIIRLEGGFSVAAGTTITLTNGTRSSNVFWIAEGAIPIGAGSNMKGTFIAHPGAVSLGAGSTIEGRLFSSEGAITYDNSIATVPTTASTIPISCGSCSATSVLNSVANFALFSSDGATSNAGSSGFHGSIGSNEGAVSGFLTSTMVGTIQNANAITAQAKTDLQTAYTTLMAIPNSNITHGAAFGYGETITPGVYNIASACSLGGTLTLDGLGLPNARFIFKIGGAFTTVAQSKVILKNGANRCNVFWIAEGAISMGGMSFMKGNMIAHDAANTMAAGGNLEGRMLSTLGAVAFSTGVVYKDYGLCDARGPLPITLSSFTGNCDNQQIALKWITATEQNSKNFAIERSIDGKQWEVLNEITAAGNVTTEHKYSYIDKTAMKAVNYFYRLNCIDLNGSNKYGNTISVRKCGDAVENDIVIYPNVSGGQFNVYYGGDKSEVLSYKIFNENGVVVYTSNGYQSKFDLSTKASGMYFVRTQLKSKIVTNKILIVK